jgi:hypothetical protein
MTREKAELPNSGRTTIFLTLSRHITRAQLMRMAARATRRVVTVAEAVFCKKIRRRQRSGGWMESGE